MWQLVINGPGYFDTQYELPEGVTQVGRADDNDIVLSGDLVSRKHARLHVNLDQFVFEDLGSRNGSKLNGTSVTGKRPLRVGDVIALGENKLVVRKATTSESAATEMIGAAGRAGVRRFGRGVDVSHAVVMARDLDDSLIRKVLDNSLPFEPGSEPPVPPKVRRKAANETDQDEELAPLSSDGPTDFPVAFNSLVMLYRVAERLVSSQSLQAFLEDTTDAVMTRVGATTGVVLVRHSSGVLVPMAVRHARVLLKGEVPVSDAIIDVALSQGQAIAVADVRDDARFAHRESVVHYGVDQVLCIPIGRRAPFDGVLYLNRSKPNEEPIEALLDVCTALAQLLETAIGKFSSGSGLTQRLRASLERFYPPHDVDEQLFRATQKGASLTHLETYQVTVLVAEIAGFIDWADKNSAQTVANVLFDLYRIATPLVFSFHGTVDRFVGDSVMAIFGVPESKGDDAIRAVRAALALKEEWFHLSASQPPEQRLRLRIGLNTGKVIAGTIGSDARLDFTAIGEPINVASWLCQTAEPGQVLVTQKTLAAIGSRFDVQPLGERPLLGSRLRTPVFEVVDEDSFPSEEGA